MKKFILAAVLLFGCLFTMEVKAQNQDEYRTVLTKYMTVSGTLASYDAMFDMMFQSMPMPAEKQTAIRTKATARLIELLQPVYQKHLSLEDLEAALAFYETPAGKRIQAAQKPMMEESMKIGHSFGMELQQMVMDAM